MSTAPHSESATPQFPPAGDVWLRVGEMTYAMRNAEAWALAWQIIGELVRQKDAPPTEGATAP